MKQIVAPGISTWLEDIQTYVTHHFDGNVEVETMQDDRGHWFVTVTGHANSGQAVSTEPREGRMLIVLERP